MVPTYDKKGQFQRLGRFTILDRNCYQPVPDSSASVDETIGVYAEPGSIRNSADISPHTDQQEESNWKDNKRCATQIYRPQDLEDAGDIGLHRYEDSGSEVEEDTTPAEPLNDCGGHFYTTSLDFGVMMAEMRAEAAHSHEEDLVRVGSNDEAQHEALRTNLVGRYDEECHALQYPQINTFLILCMRSGIEDEAWDQYSEESHEEGYYTIQIV